MGIARGSCLCGKVHYQIAGNLGVFQNCHCSRCRKVSGAMHASNMFAAKEDFTWMNGESDIVRYELSDAKYFATTFCRHCGSNLPWLSRNGKTMVIPAGTLDDDPDIRPGSNCFFGSRAPWHTNASELPNYDELPPKSK